ncbi:hypothetical protein AMAG_06160 [Allomyces macrogynus ATCC 38327]|uniref:Kinesin-like protein n=1 Tax=Allomyces macrogynus (strain ATCC 38327) TaxID=578462 RepID=A0A0L0SE32_ALLM3|nr:hypothetical protein AMAG_06160 [Allomyces macrogynus ATCC 38327]|eukprot:KNE60803.1 hypothetical protein AMAG_06160 [Allomyces macrogynus ATCC 38327]
MNSRVHVAVRVRPPKPCADTADSPAVVHCRDRPRVAVTMPAPVMSSPPSSAGSSLARPRTPPISAWGSDASLSASPGVGSALGSSSSLAVMPPTATQTLEFEFDTVFGPDAVQSDVYQHTVAPLVDAFTNGFNATVFAYGQTASGKSYTMGTTALPRDEERQGIIPRALRAIFDTVSDDTIAVQAKLSLVEIYNEDIIDLLMPPSTTTTSPSSSPGGSTSRSGLTLREDPSGNVFVLGATEHPVTSAAECLTFLHQGLANRTTGATSMNSHSSRSHAILTLALTQHRAPHTTLASKFHFVDLAGSERLKRSRAEGGRRREGIAINQGLLVLGQVISALAARAANPTSNPQPHVPYRDAKLCRLLQPALGGNSRTVMVACVSGDKADVGETVNALRYASRARAIKNKCCVNVQASASRVDEARVAQLVSENERLRAVIAAMQAERAMAVGVEPVPVVEVENVRERDAQRRHDLDAFYAQCTSLIGRTAALRSKLCAMSSGEARPALAQTAWA